MHSSITIFADRPGKAISPDLFGIFFEDINYAADGGLYAELVQNRSFEYQGTEQPHWNNLFGWDITVRGGGEGVVEVSDSAPIHPNNPHYAILNIQKVGEGVGLVNNGFGGIPVIAGAEYDVSLFARQLNGSPGPIIVRLESQLGTVYAEARLPGPMHEWARLSATLTCDATDNDARFVVLGTTVGAIGLDVISLFPRETFRNRRNGLRVDLAQSIADLEPRFLRFPGGCLVHGDGVSNMYRWKDTIGAIEERREQRNIWGYHQTVGLGYYEYFQFCEDIGAKPVPVVAAAVSCQNSSRMRGAGQQALPPEQMPEYIQEVLDLIEYANGPITSTWGAKRAEAGHPEPFHLEYLAVGNEDAQTPEFRSRFELIYNAIKRMHPEIVVIGTAGSGPDGPNFDAAWAFADKLGVEMIDEHYYADPEWFLASTRRYDGYDRAKSKVYVGEYASRGNTLYNALAEAAYLTGLERNGDHVRMAAYAPLLAKVGSTQWDPDLVYFTNTAITLTINYYVQQLFALNSGDVALELSVSDDASRNEAEAFAASCVMDSRNGDIIVKLVNICTEQRSVNINVIGAENLASSSTMTVLTGDPTAQNEPGKSGRVVPLETEELVGPEFNTALPPHSLTVIRMRRRTR